MLNYDSLKQAISFESPQITIQSRSENHKIPPIPIIRRSLPNSPELRAKLRANGYKNFSKISASGPHTLQILQNIHKSQSLKFAPKFEFDPYLCDSPYLKELNLVLKKLHCIKRLSITIRRLGDPDKNLPISKMGPNIYKLVRLNKIKIELPSTPDFTEDHIVAFYRALEKCYVLKSFEWIAVEGPVVTLKYYMCFIKLMRKLAKLEHFNEYMTNKKGIPNADLGFSQAFSNAPKIPRMKCLEMVYSAPREWNNMNENEAQTAETYALFVARHTNLERLKCRIIKSNFSYDDIVGFHQNLQSLSKLWYFEFEFLNCQMDDQELMVVAYCLTFIPQVKNICVKFIQSSPLSIEAIEQFVDRVCKMKNIEKFDLYFRKISISAMQIPSVQNIFSRFKNVNCSICPQSIYVHKNSN